MQAPLTEVRTAKGGSGSAGTKSGSVFNILSFHNLGFNQWKDLAACWISKPGTWVRNQVGEECEVRSEDVDLGFRAMRTHGTKGKMLGKNSTEDQGERTLEDTRALGALEEW